MTGTVPDGWQPVDPTPPRKNAKPVPATAQTVRYLRKQGWPLVVVVEHYDGRTRRKKDLFGFGDVLAIGPQGTLLVQTTSATNVAARIRKIRTECAPAADLVRAAGWHIHVHGWRRKPGSAVARYELHRCEDLT